MLINSKLKNKIKLNNENYLINKRTLHSGSTIPLVIYNNVEIDKALILNNNKGKTGIYR
jgi:hypothetical protein